MDQRKKLALEVSAHTGVTDLDKIFTTMWRNVRSNGGFRLSKFGYNWIKELGRKEEYIRTQKNKMLSSNTLLALDRWLQTPYYIHREGISVFDQEIAVVLLLYGGNLELYLTANPTPKENPL